MSVQLRGGHAADSSVLCCATTPDGKVLSGGENGEICLWSTDGQALKHTTLDSQDDVTSMCCANNNQHQVFVAADTNLYEFDLRSLDKAVQTHCFNAEEINQISINERDEFLAACDDAGQIQIIRLRDRTVYRTLRKHTNICASVVFRPHCNYGLLSGGYDTTLLQWDYHKSRATCAIDVAGLTPQLDPPSIVSPAFVHTVAASASGQYLACGTENALVHVFRYDAAATSGGAGAASSSGSKHRRRAHPELARTLLAHTYGVAQVHFPAFHPSALVSGGNDGQCFVWNVDNLPPPPLTNGHGGGGASAPDPAAEAGAAYKVNINHGEKINWLTTGQTVNQKFLVVADNTSNLTLYPFPEL